MKPVDEDVVAMCLAHKNGDVEIVRQLMEKRPELEQMPPDSTWIYRAASAGQIAIVDYWLDRGYPVDFTMPGLSKQDGISTPLHLAKDAAMTRHLLARGASVNAWHRGGTALHNAVIRALEPDHRGRRSNATADLDQIRALLEAGADPSLADIEGQTPLKLALKYGRKSAAQFLREAGAPEEGHLPPGFSSKPSAIDLRKDGKRIATALKTAIKKFASRRKVEPLTGLFLAVSGIEGYVMIAFDTTAADNPWDASHSEFAWVKFDKWRYAYELSESGVKVTDIHGVTLAWQTPVGDQTFERPFFEAVVAVLKQAETLHLFAPLSVVADFTLGVEATQGDHGERWKRGSLTGMDEAKAD